MSIPFSSIKTLSYKSASIPLAMNLENRRVSFTSNGTYNISCSSDYDGLESIDLDIEVKHSSIVDGGYIEARQFMSSTMTEYSNSTAQLALDMAFYHNFSLSSVDLPMASIIGYATFGYCSSLTSVSLPEVSYIAPKAFIGCKNLRSINLPKVRRFREEAFNGCDNLSFISAPSLIALYVGELSDQYGHPAQLESFYFPEVTYVGGAIGPRVAFGATKCSIIDFPKVETCGYYAFSYNVSAWKLSFPKMTEAAAMAFEGCYNVTDFYFPELRETDMHTFAKCSKLSVIDTSNFPKLEMVGDGAFWQCSALTKVISPTINYVYAGFADCQNLSQIILTASAVMDRYCAFTGLRNLTYFSANMDYMWTNAFAGCSRLTSVYFGTPYVCGMYETEPFKNTPIDGTYSSLIGGYGSIYVPSSLVTAYQTNSKWSKYSERFVGF